MKRAINPRFVGDKRVEHSGGVAIGIDVKGEIDLLSGYFVNIVNDCFGFSVRITFQMGDVDFDPAPFANLHGFHHASQRPFFVAHVGDV